MNDISNKQEKSKKKTPIWILMLYSSVATFIVTLGSVLLIWYMMGENSDEWRLGFIPETACIFPIHHSAAGENQPQGIRVERNRKMLPMHQIGAHGMAPVHRPPYGAVGIVLVKQVVFAFVKEHAVGVVHPFCCG